jgi:hypothetical protein
VSAQPKFFLTIGDAAAVVYAARKIPTAVDSIERAAYEEAKREYRESRYDYEERDDE